MPTKGMVLTGARAIFSLNGKKVGYAKGCTFSEEIEYQPIEVLDNIEVEEFVPVAYRCRMTASMFRIIKESLKAAGFFPPTGESSSKHLTNILTSQDMFATLIDSVTGAALVTVQQVKISNHSWTVDARGIVGEDAEFVAVRMLDESETV